MAIHSEAILNFKFVEMMKLLSIYLNHFPRFEKFAMSNRIRDTSYEIYDLITECQKRYHKKTSLVNLDIAHQKLRMQIYLANELGYFAYKNGKESIKVNPVQRFLAISKLIDELGKIIGGWINKQKEMGKF